MPSGALKRWESEGQRALDDIEAAYRAVGGAGRTRRSARLQVNYAYVVILSSQFQRFCRDLHTEAGVFLATNTQPKDAATVLRMLMTDARKLDHGNPNSGNIGADFRRIGMLTFWDQVHAVSVNGKERMRRLDDVNKWRNAIAHQDWAAFADPGLRLLSVKAWRSDCRALARAFDKAVRTHLTQVVGSRPW